MQGPKLAELVGAPAAVPVRAAAGVALVHIFLSRNTFEERIFYH